MIVTGVNAFFTSACTILVMNLGPPVKISAKSYHPKEIETVRIVTNSRFPDDLIPRCCLSSKDIECCFVGELYERTTGLIGLPKVTDNPDS